MPLLKLIPVAVIGCAIAYVLFGLGSLFQVVYQEQTDPTISGHLAWSDVLSGSLPTILVLAALSIGFVLALKEARR